MGNKILTIIKNYYPYLAILAVVLILFITNYKAGTYLTGWDNLHPEFNFAENIKRSFFAVWQEYQGLGLLGGMAHSADLLRQIFLLILSFVFPNELLRYIWVFLTLIIGSFGAFILSKKILSNLGITEAKSIALAGGLFYLLNIGTIQTYFVAFEAFIGHFAALPWLIFISLTFFENPTRRNSLFVFVVFLLSSPSFYLQTLFLSSIFAVTVCLIPFFFKNFKPSIKKYGKLLLIIFLSNAFWILPFLYFTISNSSVNLASKINQMATDAIFLQNKEYGDFVSIALLKGFLFSNVEPNLDGNFSYILAPWRSHFLNPLIIFLALSIFAVILLGLYNALKTKNKLGLGFACLFIFGFAMLATDTFPFSILNSVLRDNFPLFNQVFRFPYTKFLTTASLAYSVLFVLGLSFLRELIKSFAGEQAKRRGPLGLNRGSEASSRKFSSATEKINLFIILSSFFFILLVSFPAFQGHLFYQKQRLNYPKEYSKTFEYFKTQDPASRIANLPQYTFWGWNFYNWGYSGSGFLWYGLRQPVLDRAFDVWSKENENYYWEVNYAIYSKNSELFNKVLNKYQVRFLLIDKNIINPISPRSLFIKELEELISQNSNINKDKTFGNIEIYRVNLTDNPQKFVFAPKSLVSANSYNWSNFDPAYQRFGNYIDNKENYNLFYPLRSLFSGKSVIDQSFKQKIGQNYIEFEANLPEYKNSTKIHIPSLITSNNTLPVNLISEKNGSNLKISFEVSPPEIFLQTSKLGNKKIWSNTISKSLFETENPKFPLTIDVNGVTKYQIKDARANSKVIIGTTSLTLEQINSVVLSDQNRNALLDAIVSPNELREEFIEDSSFISLPFIPKGAKLVLRFPKLNDKYLSFNIDPAEELKNKTTQVVNCDNFRKNYYSYLIKEEQKKSLLELSSKNASPCVSYYLKSLDHDSGYLLSIASNNISGQGLHLWVLNEDEKAPVLDTYLPKNKKQEVFSFVLPPMEKYGKAYSIHLENISIGGTPTGNQVSSVSIYPIPYYFLTNLVIEGIGKSIVSEVNPKLIVNHPNQSLYQIEIPEASSDFPLVLSQSYSPGWKAYVVDECQMSNVKCLMSKAFPFLFGREIKNHFLVNNWENGWLVPSTINHQPSTIIIVYLPQYLEYLGFLLTGGALLILVFQNVRKLRGLRYRKSAIQ